jgi:hypothetical protein
MVLNKELINYQDKLYWVYRKVKEDQIKTGHVSDVKEFWNCDMVVKGRTGNDGILLFLRLIEDAKIIEEKPLF